MQNELKDMQYQYDVVLVGRMEDVTGMVGRVEDISGHTNQLQKMIQPPIDNNNTSVDVAANADGSGRSARERQM